MFSWKNLPTEILDNIFQLLKLKDNIQCSLTCRSWKSIAQRFLFKNLPPLNDQQMSDLAIALSSSDPGHSPGNFVKRINGSSLSDRFDVSLLDELFPFLEVIDIDVDQQILYDKLYQLIMKGNFSNFNKMPFTRWNKVHLDLVLARKQHIKDLQFPDYPCLDEMTEIFKNLHLFVKLHTLHLHCFDRASTICLEDLMSDRLTPNPVDLNIIQPLPSVREVSIENRHQFSDGAESYSFFMKKFPNVETLQIISNGYNSTISSNYKISIVECLSQFFLYLFNIKKRCHVRPLVTNQFTTEIIASFLNQTLRQKTRPCHSPKIHLKIYSDLLHPKAVRNYPSHLTAYIDASSNNHQYKKKQFELKVFYIITLEHSVLPYVDLIEGVEIPNVECLTIGNICWADIMPETITASLDWTFLNRFTNLKELTLSVVPEFTFSERFLSSSASKSGSTLELLAFEKCNFNMDIFPKISNRCSHLKILKLDRCMFSKYNDEAIREVMIRTTSINMPSTRLQELCISVCLESEADWYTSAIIRLRTATKKVRYCKITSKIPSSSKDSIPCTAFETCENGYTEDDYEMCLKDMDCKIYDIYCEEVVRLMVIAFWMSDLGEMNAVKSYPEENL